MSEAFASQSENPLRELNTQPLQFVQALRPKAMIHISAMEGGMQQRKVSHCLIAVALQRFKGRRTRG